MTFKEELIQQYQLSENKIEFIEELKELIDEISPLNHQPVNRVRWVDISQVQANDYNPNSVAKTEMKLLYTSILHDGYTQPIVTVYDKKKKKYVIVDGLGMEAEELIRLKHITGFSKLFENTEYKKAWELKKQLQIKKEYKNENPNDTII